MTQPLPRQTPLANDPVSSLVGEFPLPRRTPLANDPVGSLVGEFMEARQKEHQEENARQIGKKRDPFWIVFLLALCSAIWIAPSFIPSREPTLSQATLEQGAKLTLYLASLRVREYLETNSRLPASLPQAGVDSAGINYLRNSRTVFELSTQVQGTRLLYRSTMPDSVFLGPNLRIPGIS